MKKRLISCMIIISTIITPIGVFAADNANYTASNTAGVSAELSKSVCNNKMIKAKKDFEAYIEYKSEHFEDMVNIVEAEVVIQDEDEEGETINYIQVEASAYTNSYNSTTADGSWPAEGMLAGKVEWLGKSVNLYDKNLNYIGTYTFHDTGYGQPTGSGSSKIISGKSVGTIEAGQCIDIYMDSYSDCINWGRRTVYMVWND